MSITCAPAGMGPFEVTLMILSPSTMTTAFGITLWPSHSFPNLMAFVAADALTVNIITITTKHALILNIISSYARKGYVVHSLHVFEIERLRRDDILESADSSIDLDH